MSESIRVNSNAGKKLRVTDGDSNGKDIISSLPKTIITHILSLLPTKDVLRTCFLSKDWKYKWNCIYNIDIDDRELFSHKTTGRMSFFDFVSRVTCFSRCGNLKRFRLSCLQHCYDSRYMISWISAALKRNVENMEIAYAYEGVAFPSLLFDCTSLTKLKLQLPCTLRVTGGNWFSNLKILHLAEVKFLGDRFGDASPLLFDFPVMETLELRNCKWFKVTFVEIKSPSLTKCHVIRYSDLPEADKCQIKISRAKLLKFEFYGRFVENYDLSSSLVFLAAVDSRGGYSDDNQVIRNNGLQARLLLNGFYGLNHLKLSGALVEEIARSHQGPLLPKFEMLKRLELFTRCNSRALLELLHAMPVLELIVLNMGLQDDYDYDEVESVPSCIVSHLSEVHFFGFSGRRPDVRMADFLLKNAVELKKMLGLFRKRSEETQTENYWVKLKSVFKDGDFVVGSSIKTMADFESEFG